MDAGSSEGAAPTAPACLLVGGYGVVGKLVADLLDGTVPGRELVIAGRDPRRAQAVAGALRDGRGVRLDLEEDSTWEPALAGVGSVLVFAESDQRFARACIERGLTYVDVTPTPKSVRALLGLDEIARRCGSRARVGVGLAPGLSTALTLELLRGRDATEVTQIVELHVLDEYGALAQAWSNEAVDRLGAGARRPSLDAVPARFADAELLAPHLGEARLTTFMRLLPRPSGILMRPVARWRRLRGLAAGAGTGSGRLPGQRPRPCAIEVVIRRNGVVVARGGLRGSGQARGTAAVAMVALEDAEVGEVGVVPLYEAIGLEETLRRARAIGATFERTR